MMEGVILMMTTLRTRNLCFERALSSWKSNTEEDEERKGKNEGRNQG